MTSLSISLIANSTSMFTLIHNRCHHRFCLDFILPPGILKMTTSVPVPIVVVAAALVVSVYASPPYSIVWGSRLLHPLGNRSHQTGEKNTCCCQFFTVYTLIPEAAKASSAKNPSHPFRILSRSFFLSLLILLLPPPTPPPLWPNLENITYHQFLFTSPYSPWS